MDTIPLFNLEELTAAFALVLPAEASRRWAVEWFSRFADESSVDAEGYYLYAEWWDSGAALEPPLAVAHGSQGPTPSGWRRGISGMSPDEKAERFLMRFSELHLHLLLLVSPELEKRVQLVYQDSDESALRRRQEALRLVSDLSR